MQTLMKALYFIVGLVNFAPVAGLAGMQGLEGLYGISELPPDLLLLMQHRALMFGVIGGFMMVATFKAAWRLPAAIMCAVSMAGFMVLATGINHGNLLIERVFTIDLAAIIMLAVAVAIERSTAQGKKGK